MKPIYENINNKINHAIKEDIELLNKSITNSDLTMSEKISLREKLINKKMELGLSGGLECSVEELCEILKEEEKDDE